MVKNRNSRTIYLGEPMTTTNNARPMAGMNDSSVPDNLPPVERSGPGALARLFQNLVDSGPLLAGAVKRGNAAVLSSMLGPAYRGLIARKGRLQPDLDMPLRYSAHFDLQYKRDFPEMSRLYEAAKVSQWNASTELDWSISVDPMSDELPVLPENYLPMSSLPSWRKLSKKEQSEQRHAVMSFILSQFLHGEQGALFAANQVTEATPWMDAKLYGSTQVVDEGRHVEVFHRYLTQKLEKLYFIDDNLYVVIDALMSDSRWDVKFLGMQILIEGLALGAFGTIRQITKEPLLREMLKYVISDEARHVHYGVLALEKVYHSELLEKERQEREDWAFEVTVLLRERFLLHEVYDEYYGHAMKRREWDQLVFQSGLMDFFRKTMFRRMIPNLKRINLMSDRVRPHYEQAGLLQFEHGAAAPDLTAADLLEE